MEQMHFRYQGKKNVVILIDSVDKLSEVSCRRLQPAASGTSEALLVFIHAVHVCMCTKYARTRIHTSTHIGLMCVCINLQYQLFRILRHFLLLHANNRQTMCLLAEPANRPLLRIGPGTSMGHVAV
jgi:hypothetical protein